MYSHCYTADVSQAHKASLYLLALRFSNDFEAFCHALVSTSKLLSLFLTQNGGRLELILKF